MNINVLAFGEVLWDIIEGREHLGGAPLNFAAHVVKCGGKSSIISAVGNDRRGEQAALLMEQHGVGLEFLQRTSAYDTGTVDVILREGQPDYTINTDVAYDHIAYRDAFSRLGESFDLFYFGTLAQRSEVSAQTLKKILSENRFREVFYDINLRKKCFDEAMITTSLRSCSMFKLNTDEVNDVASLVLKKDVSGTAFCQALRESFANIHTVIITAGADGCYVYYNGTFQHIPGESVVVADAVGAGDAFSAAFCMMVMRGHDPFTAASVGNRVGAFVASQHGPIPHYSEAIKRFVSAAVAQA